MRNVVIGIILALLPVLVWAELSPEEMQRHESRKNHEASPYYKTALDAGFKDYTWITSLYSHYKIFGEDALKTWMIIVDNQCGKHYQAIQKVDQYVIYLPKRSVEHKCRTRGRDRVVILPVEGSVVSRGQFIDKQSYYIFQGVVNGESSDGFPVKLPLLKQVKINKDPSLEKR